MKEKNNVAQYDEGTLEKHQNFNAKSDHTCKRKSEINMVDCLAYGTLSESSKPGTGVYEDIFKSCFMMRHFSCSQC